ncbi:glucose-6-phosphate dehydrogenase [Candidatus Pacearchaeota archaeon]|nr:glucose-6-phosphate dehydrogenase [Candidatus Pacearchaeota archaeon]
MKEDVTLIIMGVTGDLAKRKLLPAIYNLVEKKKLDNFAVIGVSRSENSMSSIIGEAKGFVREQNQNIWDEIERRSKYIWLDFDNPEGYKIFGKSCLEIEKSFKLSGKRIFYLATLPEHFSAIVRNLKKVEVNKHQGDWPKLVFEKPFGHDLSSAQKLNKTILSMFKEKQVYRIDHYLGKELVANISLLRFTNRIFEPLWCKGHIENVQIILNEDLTIGSRGEFYDEYGVLRDMVQSHMFQLLSLIAMESPEKLEGEFVRDKKLEIFKNLEIKDVLLGQYETYNSEKGVSSDSTTPTFAALKISVDTPRWKNTPFFLKTGKALNETKAVIYIKFREVDCLLSKTCPADTNYLIINLKTNEGIALEINTKIPGRIEVEPVKLDFRIKNKYGPNTPEAYESLIEDVISENQYSFVRNDSIEYCWKALEPWLKKKLPIYDYKKGSSGPKELNKWNEKNKVGWRS